MHTHGELAGPTNAGVSEREHDDEGDDEENPGDVGTSHVPTRWYGSIRQGW